MRAVAAFFLSPSILGNDNVLYRNLSNIAHHASQAISGDPVPILGEQRGVHAWDAKDNFEFERTIEYRI
jgi:hypothetical protein